MADPKIDPVATGYPKIKSHVANVHVKDLAIVDGKPGWTMIGDGVIDWPGQLAALAADGYEGLLTLEPHLQYQAGRSVNLVAQVEEFLARMREMVKAIG